jgi:hypothetical protein
MEGPKESAVMSAPGLEYPRGIVLTADTQAARAGSHKTSRPRLMVKEDTTVGGLPITLAVAGSGFGPWIDKLSRSMWEDVQNAASFEEAKTKLEESILNTYGKYRTIRAPKCNPDAELLYAIDIAGSFGMFYAHGAIVTETKSRAWGQPIIDFLMSTLEQLQYPLGTLSFISLATYILTAVRHHADW